MTYWRGQIRRYRQAQGLTQAALAELLGVEQATVSRWERGVHVPDLNVQRKLRDFFFGKGPKIDAVAIHRIRFSLSALKLADRDGRNVAVSRRAARLHGIDAEALSCLDYRRMFTETMDEQWSLALSAGFFEGEIASMHVFNPWQPAAGGPVRYAEGLWAPTMLSDGETLLVSEFREIEAGLYHELSTERRVSVVTMDELVG
jgi:transcriptional regulator with XRE-family HTH domain